eukprot:755265-Pleurochrysis_carterae.AAC.1
MHAPQTSSRLLPLPHTLVCSSLASTRARTHACASPPPFLPSLPFVWPRAPLSDLGSLPERARRSLLVWLRREWSEESQLWVQYVSSTPATRLD